MAVKWQQLKKADPLLYEKELLPVGDIVPFVNSKNDVTPVQVEKSFLENIVSCFKEFQKVKVRVPLFKSHVEDPDNDRGTVEDVFIKANQKGKPSLFGKIRFHDAEAAKKGTRVDVSVMCPPRFRDGKGNVYMNALRHVALTSLPVVPSLAKWQGPLICSFDTPSGLMLAADSTATAPATDGSTKKPAASKGGAKMSDLIDSILEALGLTAPEGSDDSEKLRMILQEVSGTEEDAGALNLAFPAAIQAQFKKSREGEIDGLVREGVITPARGAEWKKQYCATSALVGDLKLSAADDGTIETEFDRLVLAAREMAKDRPLKGQGRTLIKLSHGSDGDEKENPLVRKAREHRERVEEQMKKASAS